jgi:pimeloyl-ACP methyl ester carboxylesterase
MSVLLPEAAVHVVEGAGHAVHLEQPAAVERVLCNESLL